MIRYKQVPSHLYKQTDLQTYRLTPLDSMHEKMLHCPTMLPRCGSFDPAMKHPSLGVHPPTSQVSQSLRYPSLAFVGVPWSSLSVSGRCEIEINVGVLQLSFEPIRMTVMRCHWFLYTFPHWVSPHPLHIMRGYSTHTLTPQRMESMQSQS